MKENLLKYIDAITKYNPFAALKTDKDVKEMAAAILELTDNENMGPDPFWLNAQKELLCALIGYVHINPAQDAFGSLYEVRNILRLYYEAHGAHSRFDNAFFCNVFKADEKENESITQLCTDSYQSFSMLSQHTKDAVVALAMARLTTLLR